MKSEMRLDGDDMKKIEYPPFRREWVRCPFCRTKLAVYDNAAKSKGVYVKCRTCKREIEIKI